MAKTIKHKIIKIFSVLKWQDPEKVLNQLQLRFFYDIWQVLKAYLVFGQRSL